MERPAQDLFPQLPFIGCATARVGQMMEILDRIELFDGFERPDLERLAAHMPCYRAPNGAYIIREGDEGTCLVIIIRGIVQIYKRDQHGRDRLVANVGPGKILGEMSLIDGAPRAATCIALEDTEFAVLDRDSLSRIIADDPTLGVKIMIEMVQMLSERLRIVTAQLADHDNV